ncbi:MAG TPA: caspase family protein, partial [Paracoccaceae bacterium]|nr:caspase family protein [Paracoccaceae bacterium]
MRLLCLLVAAVLSLPASGARAEVRAVLAGVGAYLHLDADLRGPPGDVGLMARALVARGVEPAAITALVSGTGADLPDGVTTGSATREAILSALAAAADAAAPGDTVLFYFSGHGSLAPDRDGDEAGGADQILLPADARGWRGSTGDVEGAIYDDELDAWARAALARGVRVIGILDACHSGTGFRAAGGFGMPRAVAPEALGIPETVTDDTRGAPRPPPPGDFVYLYSSQPDQRSFEYPLDPAARDGAWHGGFTLALARALAAHPALTWAQVLRIARDDLAAGPHRQDPDGEGPLLDAPVFGRAAPSLRLAVQGGEVQAGLLDGLEVGAEVALYASPQGGEVLAAARVATAQAGRATLDPAPPPGAVWAEVAAPAPPPPLRMAPPVRADAIDHEDWEAALAAVLTGGLAVAAAPGTPADLVPILTGGGLALAAGDGVLDPGGPGSTLRIVPRTGEDASAGLARVVETAAHTHRLMRVLAGLTGRSLTGGQVTLAVERRPGRMVGARCDGAGPGAAHDPAAGVSPCDELWLSLSNGTGSAQDVTVFYLAQDFTLTPIWPAARLSARLPPGGTARAGLRIEPGTPPGADEAIVVLAVPADDRPDSAPLSRLATPARPRATRAAA